MVGNLPARTLPALPSERFPYSYDNAISKVSRHHEAPVFHCLVTRREEVGDQPTVVRDRSNRIGTCVDAFQSGHRRPSGTIFAEGWI